MKEYRFYNSPCPIEGTSNWYIDLPKFPLNKEWLKMVAGADTLLDKLSEGKDEVTLKISTRKFEDFDNLLIKRFKLGLFKGAVYEGGTPLLIPFNDVFDDSNLLWLCPATLWVFWRYPKKIYFKVVNSK